MDDATALNIWLVGLGVAVVIVLAAATLLILVLLAARSIEQKAGVALGIVEQIRENTQIIWSIQDTNYVAKQLQDSAGAILANAGAIAVALHEADEHRGESA